MARYACQFLATVVSADFGILSFVAFNKSQSSTLFQNPGGWHKHDTQMNPKTTFKLRTILFILCDRKQNQCNSKFREKLSEYCLAGK